MTEARMCSSTECSRARPRPDLQYRGQGQQPSRPRPRPSYWCDNKVCANRLKSFDIMTKTRLELTKTRYSLKQCCCTTVVTSLKLNSNTTATDAVSSHILTGGCYNIFLYTATTFCPRAVLEVEDSPRGPNPWNEEMSLQAFPKKQSVMVLTPRSVAEYSTARKQLREKCWMPMAERRVDRQIHCRSWYNINKCKVLPEQLRPNRVASISDFLGSQQHTN